MVHGDNQRQQVIMATLGFTPASEHDRFSIETAERSSSTTSRTLSGEEARKFYEDLMMDNKVQSVSGSAVKQNKRRRRRSRRAVRAAGTASGVQRRMGDEGEGHQREEPSGSERSMELLGLRLLRCAHEGDIPGLKDLLSKGADINFQVQTSFLSVRVSILKAIWSVFPRLPVFPTGHLLLDGDDVCVLVRAASCCSAAPAWRRSLGWSGWYTGQGCPRPGTRRYNHALLVQDVTHLCTVKVELIFVYFAQAGHKDVLEELDSYGRVTQTDPESCDRFALLNVTQLNSLMFDISIILKEKKHFRKTWRISIIQITFKSHFPRSTHPLNSTCFRLIFAWDNMSNKRLLGCYL